MQISISMLTGQTDGHLALDGEFVGRLHRQVIDPFSRLRNAAVEAGFDLCIASAFRSFDRQLSIWNAKATGARPVLDEQGVRLDIDKLTEVQLMHAILRWSALPGASRHHWGTDMDVYDANALAAGDHPRLIPAEYESGGPFAELNQWLSEQLQSHDFYRPYTDDHGGIAPEPWHISYRPLAASCVSALSPGRLAELLGGVDIALKSSIQDHLDEIFERYIQIP